MRNINLGANGKIKYAMFFDIVKCANCGEDFPRNKKKRGAKPRTNSHARGCNCITCCRRCSRELILKRIKEKLERLRNKNGRP